MRITVIKSIIQTNAAPGKIVKIPNTIPKTLFFTTDLQTLLMHQIISRAGKHKIILTINGKSSNALISDLKLLFKGDYSFERLGFCKILINNKYYDISTLRKEIYSNNFRHPEKIIFIDSLEEDSQRRDFTINSLYMDDYYIYDEQHLMLLGQRNKKVYRLGDSVKVKCSRVDIDNREVFFDIVESEQDLKEIVPSEETASIIAEIKKEFGTKQEDN